VGIFVFLKFGRRITVMMKLFHAKFQINISNSVEMARSQRFDFFNFLAKLVLKNPNNFVNNEDICE
jgi:hypothetical protein